jgi:hypothetical protein
LLLRWAMGIRRLGSLIGWQCHGRVPRSFSAPAQYTRAWSQ